MPDQDAEISARVEKLAERIRLGAEVEHPLTPKQLEAVRHAARQQWMLEHAKVVERDQAQGTQQAQQKAQDLQAEKKPEQQRQERPPQERDRGR